jgi:hypothetical protein
MTFVDVSAADVATSLEVERIVCEFRGKADAFVFLSGGASNMSDDARRRLQGLLEAFKVLIARGISFAVGDGGTKAGLMEAAGNVRAATRGAFLLLGVAPAPDITTKDEPGKTPVDPGHSHVIAVRNPDWEHARAARGWDPSQGHWGSEIEAMYAIFDRISRGRPSVTIVANGGTGTLDELSHNLRQRRPIILVEGSGRAADALVATLRGTSPADDEIGRFLPAVEALGVEGHRELFEVFPMDRGPSALAARVIARFAGPS